MQKTHEIERQIKQNNLQTQQSNKEQQEIISEINMLLQHIQWRISPTVEDFLLSKTEYWKITTWVTLNQFVLGVFYELNLLESFFVKTRLQLYIYSMQLCLLGPSVLDLYSYRFSVNYDCLIALDLFLSQVPTFCFELWAIFTFAEASFQC